jgi:hypothetical protein
MLRLDRRLDRFLADLDAKVGAGRWAMIVTSDHGASPMPESMHGGRIALTRPDDATIQMVRVATVLARWLGVTPPSSLR